MLCSQISLANYFSDWITSNQDFYISPVTDRTGLYVAFGGSLHAWKFLTNIGSYIVKMMGGDNTFYEKWERWTPNSKVKKSIHGEIDPKRSFPDK